MRVDYENLRRAMSWAAEQDDPQLLDTMTARLYSFWTANTHLAEACVQKLGELEQHLKDGGEKITDQIAGKLSDWLK